MIAGQNATRTGECGTSYSVPLFLSSVDFVKKIRYTQYKLFFQRGGNGQMKRINSIYRIFVLFLAIIVVSFLILYCYSTINLKTSLRRVAKIQMEYSYDQLEQKIKEIELEASSILTREETKLLQVAIVDNEDIYSYVMKVKTMQEIFQEKQKTNSGMAEFDLYWPEEQRIVSSTTITSIKGKKILDKLQDNQWIISENEVYF